MKKIVLKSTSPRRKDLLSKMGYEFEIKSFDVDESIDCNSTPFENVKRLGFLKASVRKEEDYGKVLIGCDTIVVLDDKIYGKPKDKEDAYNMLKSLSNKRHQVMSGLCVIYKDKILNDVCVSDVYFKDLSDSDINSYIDSGECFGKAGAYAIQGIGSKLIDHYEGSFDSIVGLPTELLERFLGEVNEMED